MPQTRGLVLASTSRYRRDLLDRLGFAYRVIAPGVDEQPLPGEAPAATALRLAQAKARSVSVASGDALVIGSDQVASLGDLRLEKPGTRENAMRQLLAASGRVVRFDTALCVLDAASGRSEVRITGCDVEFRTLDAARIGAYLDREEPFDCAGSAKAEGLGIALIRRIATDDPTALIGLPLIALTEMLESAGLPVLG